jgi:sialic acid synthase SpsE
VISIRGRALGPGHPAYVIAEMAWAHDGSVDKALEIASASVAARADALNVHLTSLPDYMVRAYGSGDGRVSGGRTTPSVYEYLDGLLLPTEGWQQVADTVHSGGLALSCMANDVPSLALADRLGADIYVVPPAALAERVYLDAVGERSAPVMLGVGGATLAEIEHALNVLTTRGAGPIVLQYGIQAYPTDPAVINLRYLATLQRAFGLQITYHDHTEAGTRLASSVPILALGLGIAGIEKHMTHNRAVKGEDWESALEPAELADFVQDVRVAEAALGQSAWRPLGEAELNYRRVVRKRAVARRALSAGTPLDYDSVTFKRGDAGLYADEFERVLGRPIRVELEADAPIELSVVAP